MIVPWSWWRLDKCWSGFGLCGRRRWLHTCSERQICVGSSHYLLAACRLVAAEGLAFLRAETSQRILREHVGEQNTDVLASRRAWTRPRSPCGPLGRPGTSTERQLQVQGLASCSTKASALHWPWPTITALKGPHISHPCLAVASAAASTSIPYWHFAPPTHWCWTASTFALRPMPSASLGDPSLPLPLVLFASKVLTLALYSPLSPRFGSCSNWIDSSSEIGSFFAYFHFSGVIRKGAQRSRAM